MYTNTSSLALENSGGSATKLPLALPAHLQPAAGGSTEVMDATVKREAPSNKAIDDAVGNW
jgi:hypothetical protein